MNINKKNKYGTTPLHTACINCNTHMVELLLTHPNIKVNEINKQGIMPLAYACYHNSINIVSMLLRYPGIDINRSNTMTPLHLTTNGQNIGIVNLLLFISSLILMLTRWMKMVEHLWIKNVLHMYYILFWL